MSEVGKSAFGICHHNQSRKQIYCPGFTMMFDEPEQILLTLCISMLLRPLCFASSSVYEAVCFGRNINKKPAIKMRYEDFTMKSPSMK